MAIRQISLNNFRNLKSTTVDFHKNLNIITGSNASGKTSLLEALHIICQGRSFKTHIINNCVQTKKKSFLLFAKFSNYKAGISRSSSKTTIRIDNKNINQISFLAKKTAIRIINNSTLDLILGNPADKREFIDWCLFHVEHSYQNIWLNHKHALKQRNALLKNRSNLKELDYWDTHLSELSIKIYDLRLKYLKTIKQIFDDNFNELLSDTPVDLIYKPGWDINNTLIDELLKSRSKDIKFGFTSVGTHRDDIKIYSNGVNVKVTFSRGEIKKLSLLLYISQIILLKQLSNTDVIILIDDISAELDNESVEYILNKLSKINIQIFITNITNAKRLHTGHEEYKLFHVEHGIIKPVKIQREHNV